MVFKCKMCGGDIIPIEGTNTGKCEYCKSVMTLPNSDDEKIVNLYNRANFLRISNDFDKAKDVYESILTIDNKQIEAHWGILLCKYGVEYVDDPKTKAKVPTCHRTMDTSILNDSDFKLIKKESYGDALDLYIKEAEAIDKIQKDILSISLKEKPYDVFICYKETDDKNERTHDSVIAQDIYDKLVEQGFKVFFARITLEDKLGQEYEPYIYSALKSAKVMLVVGTKEEYFNAVWVKNEWSRYLEMIKQDKGKTLIPVFSKIDPYKLPEEFSMLQAQSMDKVGAMQDLVRGVKKLVNEYSQDGVSDYDKETIAKVASALDDARSIGNGKYEVTIVKENLPLWYYLLMIGFGGLSFMLYVAFLSDNIFRFLKSDNYRSMYDVSKTSAIFITLSILIFFAALAASIFKRKFVKFRKVLIISSLAFFVSSILLCAMNYYIPARRIGIYLLLIMVGYTVVFFINPSWKLNMSTKTIMDKDDKDKQIEKNKQIKEKFTTKEKSPIKLLYILIISILPIIICCLAFYKLSPKFTSSNKLDESKDQIEILTTKYIYNKPETYSSYKGYVIEGDYYDILEFKSVDSTEFVKIKTNKNITGWIRCNRDNKMIDFSNNIYNIDKKTKDTQVIIHCRKENGTCEERYLTSNKRDPSKLQVQVATEYINVRRDHNVYSDIKTKVYMGNIYTVLDTYEEYNQVWYKIKSGESINGWIAGKYNDDINVIVLEKE